MVAENNSVIVIRLDADHERGLGHLYRMLTLANAFRQNGFECFFVVRQNETTELILKDAKYDFWVCPSNLNEDEIVDYYFNIYSRPDIWIFDILSTEEKTIIRVREKGVAVVCFDDLLGGPAAADLVVNAIAGCWDGVPLNKNVLAGPSYALIDPAILVLRHKPRLKGELEAIRVGVTMGGSDTHGATVKVATILSRLADINVDFFLGPHFLHNEELNKILDKVSYRFTTHKAVKNLHSVLLNMDIVICGGGQTLFELCSMGLPVIAIANEPHEEKTIGYFSKRGACLSAGSVGEIDVDDAICSFLINMKKDLLAVTDLAQKAISLVDGKGCARCYQACLKILSSPII